MEHHDGDVAFVLEVVRKVDSGHAADTEFAVEAIAVREGAGQSLGYGAHAAVPTSAENIAAVISANMPYRSRPCLSCGARHEPIGAAIGKSEDSRHPSALSSKALPSPP